MEKVKMDWWLNGLTDLMDGYIVFMNESVGEWIHLLFSEKSPQR